ncbi:hypothetical protein niasHT_015532 [Heterodera trifolii]|uniref:Uncharacterized protein n=1 Tax=Heterodera trifolii TaxID=157864 RepID=A0ABD2L1A9_9BILA
MRNNLHNSAEKERKRPTEEEIWGEGTPEGRRRISQGEGKAFEEEGVRVKCAPGLILLWLGIAIGTNLSDGKCVVRECEEYIIYVQCVVQKYSLKWQEEKGGGKEEKGKGRGGICHKLWGEGISSRQ